MQIRTVLKSLIFPHPAVIAILSITVFPLNCLVLIYEKEEQWYAPVVFFFSFYTLLILSICIVRNVRRLIYSFQGINLFLNNRKRKAIISLYASTAISIAYSIFKSFTGILYFSPFSIFGAIYFAIAAIMKLLLLKHIGKSDEGLAARRASFLMLFLDLSLIGMTIHAVLWHEGAVYPGYLLYAAAFYAFYSLGIAIRSLLVYRSIPSPAIKCAKAIMLSSALLSIFSLQTAMFSTFGGDERFQTIMNALTGCVVAVANTAIAIFLILRNRKKS